jgi:hypothetical protein
MRGKNHLTIVNQCIGKAPIGSQLLPLVDALRLLLLVRLQTPAVRAHCA